jgi:hypothetical protein
MRIWSAWVLAIAFVLLLAGFAVADASTAVLAVEGMT